VYIKPKINTVEEEISIETKEGTIKLQSKIDLIVSREILKEMKK